MACCGNSKKRTTNNTPAPQAARSARKAGALNAPVDFGDRTVGLTYNLPGMKIPVTGSVTNQRYWMTQGKETFVHPLDADYLLKQYNTRRKIDVYTKTTTPAAPKPQPVKRKPKAAAAPKAEAKTDTETEAKPKPKAAPKKRKPRAKKKAE